MRKIIPILLASLCCMGFSVNPKTANVTYTQGPNNNTPVYNLDTSGNVVNSGVTTSYLGFNSPNLATNQSLCTNGVSQIVASGFTCGSGGGSGGGSGNITVSPQYSIPFYSLSGSSNTIQGAGGITTDATQNDLIVQGGVESGVLLSVIPGVGSQGELSIGANGNGNVNIFAPLTITPGGYNITLPPSQGASNTVLQNNGSGTLSWSAIPSGATNYIQNTSTLQSGATFYVSSGTVQGQFIVNGNQTIGGTAIIGSIVVPAGQIFGTQNTNAPTIQAINNYTGTPTSAGFWASAINASNVNEGANGSAAAYFQTSQSTAIYVSDTAGTGIVITGLGSPTALNILSGTILDPVFNTTTTSMTVTGFGGLGVTNSLIAGGATITGTGAGQIALTQGVDSTVSPTASATTFWGSTSSGAVFTNGVGVSTYTVVGSSASTTIGHIASWSGQGTLIDGGTGGGTGSPGGSSGQIQYNNSSSFGGVPDTVVTTASMTFNSGFGVQFDTVAIQTSGGVGGQLNIYNSGGNNRQFGFYTDAGAYMGELYLLSGTEEILDDETLGPLYFQTGGTTRFDISYAGQTQVLSSMTVTGNLLQNGSTNIANSGSNIGGSFTETQSSATTGINFAYGIEGQAFNTEASSGPLGTLYGGEFTATNVSTNPWQTQIASLSQATNSSTGTVTNSYATYSVSSNQGTGIITRSYDSYFQDTLISGSTTTTRYGTYIDNPSLTGGSSLGTNYAIYIATQSSATSNYGIFVGGGQNQFDSSNLNVYISSNGYVGSTGGSAPTFSGCGTTPTVTAGSNNMRGSVTMTAGLSSACTIIPASPVPQNYFCVINGGGAGTAVFFQQSANLTASCDNATGLVTCGVGTFMTWQCSGTN